jgi:glutamyl-tRNA synthetase
MTTKIKTRFAPSPTGELHIGGLRTALYNYLFAKKNNGEFVLRIEDTDQARFQEGSLASIIANLEWAGITPSNQDNPVYQSKRKEIYQKYADKLIEQGHAYYCFCTAKRLEEMRETQKQNKQAPKYDRHCLDLSKEDIQKKINTGEKYVIRMKMLEGETVFTDLVRGEVKFNNKEIDDQVLIKSDGFPTYHLANVVDDHEMEISHVLRAEEWLPSTPKHIALYTMFDWQPPIYGHIPLVLAPDKSKLSKRHGATSVTEFKHLGFLPEALLNFLALLGWNPGDEREIFSLSELEKEFDISKVHQAGAVFDIEKLEWMNGAYIREINIDNLVVMCLPYLIEANLIPEKGYDLNFIKQIVSLEQSRIKKLSELPENIKYFFQDINYETELLKWRKSDLTDAKQKLHIVLEEITKIPPENWTRNSIENLLMDVITNQELGTGNVLWPMRVALSGAKNSPGPFEIAEILGKEKTLTRLQKAIQKLN